MDLDTRSLEVAVGFRAVHGLALSGRVFKI